MATISGSRPEFSEPGAPVFSPSESARGWLLLGCLAALVDAGLSVAGMTASLLEAQVGRFQMSQALDALALAPQLIVLFALLALAREAGSRGLWKSSVGLFGAHFLFLLFALAADDDLPRRWSIFAAILVGCGIVALLIVAFGNLPRFAQSETETEPAKTGSSEMKGKGCLASAAIPIGLIAAKLLFKGAIFKQLKLGLDGWVLIEGGLLAIMAVSFLLWFALTKIRLSEKLGSVAALLGAYEILLIVGFLGAVVSFFMFASPALFAQPAPNDAEVERLAVLWERGITVAGMVAYPLWAALTAWLFLGVRKMGERDWRFEFSADGVRPWQSS